MSTVRARYKHLAAILLAGFTCIFLFAYPPMKSCISGKDMGYLFCRKKDVFAMDGAADTFAENLTTKASEVSFLRVLEQASPGSSVRLCPKRGSRIFFLKTHKTGSSTITNILNRSVERQNSTICLPRGKGYSFSWPKLLNSRFIQGRGGNVFANHARYLRNVSLMFFPATESFYVSIMRDPVRQWESTFQFYNLKKAFGIRSNGSGIQEFIEDPPQPENICKVFCLAKNPTTFDFGLDHIHHDDPKRIADLIRTISEDFQLILIAEYFDESLVLLRRRLCWSYDDIVYLKLNARPKEENKAILTENLKAAIRDWNKADVVLYEHFRGKLLQEIRREGPNFHEDVAEFRRRLRYYRNICIAGDRTVIAYGNRKVAGFVLKANLPSNMDIFCEQMTRQELQYVDYFREMFVKKTLIEVRRLHEKADQLMTDLTGMNLT